MSMPRRVRMTWILGAAMAVGGCRSRPTGVDRFHTVIVPYATDEWAMSPEYDDAPRRLVFQTMVRYDELWCGKPLPGLAKRWEHSDDLKVWTMTLDPRNRWQDGVPVTSADIKFTIDLWHNPDVHYWYGSEVDSVVIVDDTTFRVYQNRPSRMMLDSWIVYYPKHLLEHLDPKQFYKWDYWKHPIGDGPFRYVRTVPKTLIEYAPNPDYVYGEPRIGRLILRFGERSLPQLLAGDVDILLDMSPLDVLALRHDPRFTIYYERIPAGYFILWNLRNPLFADRGVRRALTMAIDRKALHAALGFPADIPVTDGVYTACQFRRNRLPPAWPYDTAAAARLLRDAGWRDTNGDGVRDKGGRAFRFTLSTGTDLTRQTAVFVQDQLRRIGVAVDVQTLEQGVLQDRARAGRFDATIFHKAGNGWDFYQRFFGRDAPGGYRNLRVARLFDQFSRAEPARQQQIAGEIADSIYEGLPGTYLYPSIATHVVASRIKGFTEWRDPLAYLEHAWIAPDSAPSR